MAASRRTALENEATNGTMHEFHCHSKQGRQPKPFCAPTLLPAGCRAAAVPCRKSLSANHLRQAVQRAPRLEIAKAVRKTLRRLSTRVKNHRRKPAATFRPKRPRHSRPAPGLPSLTSEKRMPKRYDDNNLQRRIGQAPASCNRVGGASGGIRACGLTLELLSPLAPVLRGEGPGVRGWELAAILRQNVICALKPQGYFRHRP